MVVGVSIHNLCIGFTELGWEYRDIDNQCFLRFIEEGFNKTIKCFIALFVN